MSSRRITPAKQGQLDGACGFYAILNAMTALEHSLQKKEVFTHVISAFMQDGNFSSYFEGTRRGTIKNTLSRVIDYFNTQFEFYDDKTHERYEFEFAIPYWQHDFLMLKAFINRPLTNFREKYSPVMTLSTH